MSQQPSRVLYLPPGVAAAAPQAVAIPGLPFDRNFFQNILPQAIQSFCTQVECGVPVVELLTVDGTTHFVNGISGVSDQWVALHTSELDHEHVKQVFVPYQTIFRVEVHPAENERRHRLGFLLGAPRPMSVSTGPDAPAVPPVNEKPRAAAKKVSAGR
ncbi:MAG: hypothetical protein HYX53_05660 [Chloroflexi bacterium]|nr:hypothetical protein [Chloroflexota bacterium]